MKELWAKIQNRPKGGTTDKSVLAVQLCKTCYQLSPVHYIDLPAPIFKLRLANGFKVKGHARIKGVRYLVIIHEVLVAMGFFLQGC